jgi:sulfate/thiosulfate transport system substrate-binding protein
VNLMLNRRAFVAGLPLLGAAAPTPVTLLNVSFDPTRALYRAYNAQFATDWQRRSGQPLTISQSHGGSGKQARAVMDGLPADVVTLALASDIDRIARRGLIAPDWVQRLPHNSAPMWSPIVFLVRRGNPKRIAGWDDLVNPGVRVILANPHTSGGARWAVLVAMAHGGQRYLEALVARIPLLDTGNRGATISFAQRRIGDVLITVEAEALMALRELGDGFELVVPPLSIRGDMPVAVVDGVAKTRGSTALARAYLKGLFAPRTATLLAAQGFRPTNGAAPGLPATSARLISVADFGGWDVAERRYFADGAAFDRALAAAR